MKYDFDQIIDRRQSASLKWNIYEKGVIPMWLSDMDFPSPQPVIDALRDRVEHGIFGYPVPPDELATLITGHMADSHNWEITTDDIVYMPGVNDGINYATGMISPNGSHILVQPPVYEPLMAAAGNANQQLTKAELSRRENGDYCIDYDLLEEAITPRTRLFMLCNPHNPVGRVYTRDELERIADICLRNDLIICSDEVHCNLVYPGHQHIPIASLDPRSQHAQSPLLLLPRPSIPLD